MQIIDIVRLLRRHIVLLIITPVLMVTLVFVMTKKPDYRYASETKLYTGIASGSGVELDKSLSYFATNTAFDNLINIIKSRETQQEVAIKLLAQHLLLDKADPKFLSAKSYNELKRITPEYVYRLIGKNALPSNQRSASDITAATDSLNMKESFSFSDLKSLNNTNLLPSSIDPLVYQQAVRSLTDLMSSSDTNFVYRLLNFEHPHYSIKALSSLNVQRIGTSDLVQLKYETDDPGVCQQTLALLIEACIKNFKDVKENRSDAVVKYFEFQLRQAASRLKVAEDKLLQFNKDNNIINYYEQSKAIAIVKEQLDVDFNNMRIKLAGVKAAIKRLEEKLGNQQQIQLKSANILDIRNRLGEVNYQIAHSEMLGKSDAENDQKLADLKALAEKLKDQIKEAVNELYTLGNSTEGLPLSTILTDWIDNVIEAENLKAEIEVLGERIKEFQKQYAIYAPAGANLKRIEREISVSEQEFLEILHGLNLAKLKQQDNELSSNLKTVDEPFFPLSPIPTKRKILIVMAAMVGFVIVLAIILVLEYFDDTIKNQNKTSKILKMPLIGIFPKILLKLKVTNFPFIFNRLLEMTIQDIEIYLEEHKKDKSPKTLLFFSTLPKEGKSVVAGNLAHKLKKDGEKVVVLNYSDESLYKAEQEQIGYKDIASADYISGSVKQRNRISFIPLILGYPDTRIDFDSPFLENPENYLGNEEIFRYNIDEKFNSVKNYQEILDQNGIRLSSIPDYILIELPPVLHHPYPVGLIMNADLPVLVCRSNRVWTPADQGAIDTLVKMTGQKTHFILNGVELSVIESVLGDLPKKRSRIRRAMKNILRFQFFSKNQI